MNERISNVPGKSVEEAICPRCGPASGKDDNEVAELMKLRLAHIALTDKSAANSIAAIDKWLDRQEGKPIQRQVVIQSDGESWTKLMKMIEEREAKLLIDNTNLGKTEEGRE